MNSRRSPIPTYGTTTIQDYPGDYPNNEFRMDYQQQQHYQYPPLQMNYLEPHHHQHHPNDHLMSLGTPQEERTLFDFQFQNLHDVLPQDMMNLVPNPSPPFSPNFHSYFDHHPHNLNFIATQPMGLSLNVDPITQDTSSQPPQPPSHHYHTGPNNNRIMSLPDISLTESDPIKINVPASHKKSKLSLNSKSKSTKSRIRRASSRPESNINKSDPTTDLDSEPKGEPRQYECHIPGCTKIFKRSEHLKRHVRSIHSTEKPFPCPTCGKHFSRSDNLNQHLRIHARPKTKISTIRARPTQPYPMDFDHLLPFLPYYSPQHQDPTTLPTFPSPYPTSIMNEEGNGFPATTFSPYLPSPSQS